MCPKCNHEISDNSSFCSECGTNIIEYLWKLEQKKYIKCPNCTKKVEKDTTFCKYCGNKIEKPKINKMDKETQIAFFIVWASILVIFFCITILVLDEYNTFGGFGFGNSNISTPIEPPRATIEVINSHLTNLGYGLQKIEGIIENTSATVCEYPNVEIYTYDASGNRVGEHSAAPLNALNPGETYKFSIYANGASRYSVETCSCN